MSGDHQCSRGTSRASQYLQRYLFKLFVFNIAHNNGIETPEPPRIGDRAVINNANNNTVDVNPILTRRAAEDQSVDECLKCNANQIHIGMVVVGRNASRHMVVTVKSILAARTTALHLHVLVDSSTEQLLRSIFASWPVSCLRVSFHVLLDHVASIAWVPTVHGAGVYGLAKLIYDQLLPEVSRIIAIDTGLHLS